MASMHYQFVPEVISYVKFPHLAACWLSDRLPSAEITDGVRMPWCQNAFMPTSEGQAAVKAVAESILALQHICSHHISGKFGTSHQDPIEEAGPMPATMPHATCQ